MTYEALKREMEKYPETMSEGERMQKYAAGEDIRTTNVQPFQAKNP